MLLEDSLLLGIKIVFFNFLFLKYSHAGAAWFQVCDSKRKYALSSTDCRLGLWLNKPLKVDCVCVNGVWILNDGLCDDNAMIIVGSGHCFLLSKTIRSLKLLGKPEDPFASVSYVTDENFDTFVKIPDRDYNNRLDSHTSLVVSIFPKKILKRSDHQVCLESPKSYKPVHIWKNDRRVSSRFKFIDDSKCEMISHYDFHIGLGEIFQDGQIRFADTEKKECSSKCLIPPEIFNHKSQKSQRGFGRGISSISAKPSNSLKNGGKTNIQWENLYATNMKLDFDNGQALNEPQKKYQMKLFKFRWNFTLPALSHAREVREQSVRMVQAQTNFLLLNQPPPKINTFEYDYFQKLRQVFVGVVPDDVISHDVVNGLMRMFRLVLWESHDKFEYSENPNPEQYSRIMSKLNECVWNVTAYPFVFTEHINDTGRLDVDNKPIPDDIPRGHNVHPCLERTVETYWNDSDQGPNKEMVKFIHTDQNMWNESYIDWRRETFNVTYDFVIELAWKIYVFGFYRCYNYFIETATDGHELADKVQSLFNHRVVKRWYQPEDFNKVLPLLFPKLNLTQFAWAVDKMTVASRESTIDWIDLQQKRPIPMNQEDMPHENKLKDLGSKSGRRKKRRVDIMNIFKERPFWSKLAFCMSSFSDPIVRFKYETKPGCYIA